MRRWRARNALVKRHREALVAPLSVTCWCEEQVVDVPTAEVRRGLTRSCGRRGCEAVA